MGKKEPDRSKNDVAGAELPNPWQGYDNPMADVPDLTPEQWEWLKEQSSGFEGDYLPTRSLIQGI